MSLHFPQKAAHEKPSFPQLSLLRRLFQVIPNLRYLITGFFSDLIYKLSFQMNIQSVYYKPEMLFIFLKNSIAMSNGSIFFNHLSVAQNGN